MSDLATMARPYCERLAKACPDRFHFGPIPLSGWGIVDKHGESINHARGYSATAADFWNFFGPLADEFHLDHIAWPHKCLRDPICERMEDCDGGCITTSLLEGCMAAVCEAVERQAKETPL